jgi:peptidoglycan/LPS O-acetylase OafA/YrhL
MNGLPIIRQKMPELDSVRGIAILSVLFYHGFVWSNGLTGLEGTARFFVEITRFGWLGVNLFFVLSGFLITGILVESKQRDDYYRRFYIRRALRILPAFYAVLLVLALTPSQNGKYLFLSFFYLSNFAPLFAIPMTYGMLWSLAVEEHFYMLWPLVVRRLSLPWLMAWAIGIVLVVPGLRAIAFGPQLSEGFNYYTWFVADGLATGAILALFVRMPGFCRKNLAQLSGGAIAIALLLLVGGTPWGMLTRQRILGAVLMLTAWHFFFMGVIGLSLLAGTSRWSWIVNRPILQFFGNISYGLYLIHWLVFMWYDDVVKIYWPSAYPPSGRFGLVTLRFVCVAGVATALSYLSRRFFEEPFLNLKDRFGARAHNGRIWFFSGEKS